MELETHPKVSVLVPCYNVQDYVEQCLESLRNQTLQDIEVIMINDGSKDGTLEILKRYQALDPRFKLIDKPNSGYGDSMNKGLAMASGDYVGILESDDFVDTDMYLQLYQASEQHQLDLCKSEFYLHCDGVDTERMSDKKVRKNTVLVPRENTEALFIMPAIWTCLFKRQWLLDNEIRFLPTPGASFQDVGFAFKTKACADRFMYIDSAFIHYRVTREGNSATSSGKEYCICDEVKEIMSFAAAHKNSDRLIECAARLRAALYRHNILRFTPSTLPGFIDYWRQENIELKQKGLLRNRLYKGIDKRIEFLIMNFPGLAKRYLLFKYGNQMQEK